MNIIKTALNGVYIVESNSFIDHRGSFSRLFCDKTLKKILITRKIAQINQSITVQKGSIRGLHYQYPPHAEMKLVRCLKGKIFDVAVDLRKGSKTFLQWHAEILTPEKSNMLVVPEGFAHGFQTLDDNSELLYLTTAYYEPGSETAIAYNDPALNINWPIELTDISKKDKSQTFINDDFIGLNTGI